jgi:hypothetical protein
VLYTSLGWFFLRWMNKRSLTFRYVLIAGSGYIGMATAFNALSEHGACTVWFTFLSFALSTALALFPKLSQIGMAGKYPARHLFDGTKRQLG